MYVYLDFYKQFQCIGTECLDSCCATGWQIPLDARVSEYYQNLKGEFGDFLRQNMERQENGVTLVKLTSGYRCPFLNEKGLCRIYIECGEEWMSDECQIFPRARYDKNGNSMRGFTVSCEEVLRMLYEKPDSVRLSVEGTREPLTAEELSFYKLARFIEWGMELIQDETVPFGTALATVVYLSLEAEPYFIKRDYENFEAVLHQAPEIAEQFMQAGQAGHLIFVRRRGSCCLALRMCFVRLSMKQRLLNGKNTCGSRMCLEKVMHGGVSFCLNAGRNVRGMKSRMHL